jgi:hypothetical protein
MQKKLKISIQYKANLLHYINEMQPEFQATRLGAAKSLEMLPMVLGSIRPWNDANVD